MKLIGFILLGYGVLALAVPFFNLSETTAKWVAGILSIVTSLFMPEFKQFLALKLHWRIALTVGILCSFYVVYLLTRSIIGNYQAYSLSVSFFIFGLMALLFSWLDGRKV